MTEQPYHKYVFDTKNRKFVGQFEEMYLNENRDNYDSWFQEDLTNVEKQISLIILGRHNFNSILDIGCGKGTFTHLLKKTNNQVLGVDISETAIRRAKAKYRNVDFLKSNVRDIFSLERKWDLVIAMEILSYLENWKLVLGDISNKTSYLYVTLYLPQNPIGFVKSFDELRNELKKYFDIETELILNSEVIFIMCKKKSFEESSLHAS